MAHSIQPGQQFTWSMSEDGTSGKAIVTAVKTDREEGLSPESEDYVALWIEATGLSGFRSNQVFEIVLGTDGKSYLDGKVITVAASERIVR